MAAQNAGHPPPERILPIALFLKAVALAAREFPDMNGHYTEGAFHPSPQVHVGVVIALRPSGLLAPALHDADQKTPAVITRELTDLVTRVRSGHVKGSELTDPTITVTSLGDDGPDRVFGIIYPPQVALVGFGRVRDAVVVEKNEVLPHRVVSATLAADHRVSDGLIGSAFLNAVAKSLQNPKTLEAGR
jgi:pyruvate dehydrogenase E2 component (dihydrolipoamide acetyltransferase)